jgi:CheY-like chemotaxis protein
MEALTRDAQCQALPSIVDTLYSHQPSSVLMTPAIDDRIASTLSKEVTGPLSPIKAFGSKSARRSIKTRTARRTRARQHHRAVLVVDDVTDVTEMIALFLKHAGFDVMTANSAGAALQLAEANAFDLIISDIGMPEMNGYQLAESIRKFSHYSLTPMIAVTGYTEYDDRGRSLSAGFNAHLTKPINPSQLLDLIGELLAEH